jgi:hypothetical protein
MFYNYSNFSTIDLSDEVLIIIIFIKKKTTCSHLSAIGKSLSFLISRQEKSEIFEVHSVQSTYLANASKFKMRPLEDSSTASDLRRGSSVTCKPVSHSIC